MVPISAEMKKQLSFWFYMIQVCAGRGSIPDPDASLPSWAVDIYTDAAGGTTSSPGHGAGVVCNTWWAYLPWSRAINRGDPSPSGRSLARGMSALELVGPLLAISSGYHLCKNTALRLWVDNAGSVYIWKKGYSSSCQLSTTLVKAIAQVAAGLGCTVDIVKVTRCSTPLATMADALSKAAFMRFWDLARSTDSVLLPLEPGWVPPALLQWVAAPKNDDELGHKILSQVALKTKVLGYNC